MRHRREKYKQKTTRKNPNKERIVNIKGNVRDYGFIKEAGQKNLREIHPVNLDQKHKLYFCPDFWLGTAPYRRDISNHAASFCLYIGPHRY